MIARSPSVRRNRLPTMHCAMWQAGNLDGAKYFVERASLFAP